LNIQTPKKLLFSDLIIQKLSINLEILWRYTN